MIVMRQTRLELEPEPSLRLQRRPDVGYHVVKGRQEHFDDLHDFHGDEHPTRLSRTE